MALGCVGLPTGALGVAWPDMRSVLDRPLGDLGILLLATTLGYGIASLAYGALARRMAVSVVLIGGALTSAVGALGFCVGSWPVVLAAAVLIGAAAGTAESALNAHVTVTSGPRAIQVMHGAFGVGATVGPLAVTLLLGLDLAWQWVFVALAIIELGLAVGYRASAGRWDAVGGRPAALASAPPAGHTAPRLDRRQRALLLGALATFAAYVALETAAGQWAFVYLHDARELDESVAGVVVAAYWAALTLGRFGLGAAGHRTPPRRVLDASIPLALATTVVVWVAGPVGAVIGLVACGAALAGIFPASVSLTALRFGAARTDRVMGWQLAAGSVGLAIGPLTAGALVERSGPAVIAPLLVGLAVLLVGVHGLVWVVSRSLLAPGAGERGEAMAAHAPAGGPGPATPPPRAEGP